MQPSSRFTKKKKKYQPNVLQVHLSIRPNVGNIVPVSTEYCKGFVRLLMPKTDSAVLKNFMSQAVKQDVSAKYPDGELLTWSAEALLSLYVNVLWKISKDVYMLAYICCNCFLFERLAHFAQMSTATVTKGVTWFEMQPPHCAAAHR